MDDTQRSPGSLPPRLAASIAEGTVFGRESVLGAVTEALLSARPGAPPVIVIAGDPGMGKTRLVAEVAEVACGQGRRVLYGRSEEGVDGAYQPIAECLMQLLGDAARDVDSRGRASAEVRRLVSGLPLGEASRAAGERPGERYLLFNAVRAALEAGSRPTGLLLALEDLHWADEATVSMLRHLLAAPETPNATFLLTYRSGELGDAEALEAALTEPERRDSVVRVTLTGLATDDVALLVRERVGALPSPAEAERLQRETGGNPFFVKQILGADEGTITPDGIRSVIRRRVRLLGAEVSGVLTTAAVGGGFDLELIARVSDRPIEQVMDAAREAERAGLVVDRGDTGLDFAHSLIRQALYAELTAVRRGGLHRRFAEALNAHAGRRSDGDDLERAHHWLAALPAEPERIGASTLRAGLITLERRDPDAAARWFEHAIEAAGRTGDQRLRTEALIGLGGALLGKGDGSARDVLLRAARLAQQRGDQDALVRAALRNHRGFASVVGSVDEERVAVVEAAIEAVGQEDTVDRALLLNTLATELYFVGDEPVRSLALGDEAVAVARRVGDRFALATVLAPRQARWSPEGLDEQERGTKESVALADRLGDPLLQFRALRWRGMALLAQGRVQEAQRTVARQDRLARELGDPTARFLSAHDRSSLALVRGRLADAEALANEALGLGLEAGQPDAQVFYANTLAAIRWDQGRLGELAELAAAAASRTPDNAVHRPLLALAYADAGLRAESAAVLAVDVRSGFGELRRDVTWLVAMTAYAHVAADVEDRDAARRLLDLLGPWHGRIAWNSAVWGGVDLALGRLALATGDLEQAGAYLAASRSLAERWGAPVWHARTLLEQGRLHLALGDITGSLELLERASDDASQLGARSVAHQAGTLTQRTRAARALAGSPGGLKLQAPAPIAPSAPIEPGQTAAHRAGTLTLNGESWAVTLDGNRVDVPDNKGMRYLALLLEVPGIPRHAAELQAGVTGGPADIGHAGPLLDDQARAAYRTRLEELEDTLEEAERFGDHERASRARDERAQIGRQLAAAVGLHGRSRRAADAGERARINVVRALKRAVTRIGSTNPDLEHHLRSALRTGTFCVYDPPPADRVAWQVSRPTA